MPPTAKFGIAVGEGLEGEFVLHAGFARQNVEPDAFDPRRRTGEVSLDEFLVEADGFEDLRAAIALQRGDAHLGEDLQQALVDGLDVVIERLFGSDAVGQLAAQAHVLEGLDGEIGIDGAGSVADEQRIVHDLARLAGFDDERDLGAGLLADQVVVNRGEREQARDGRVVFVDAAIGNDDQGVAGFDGERRAAAEAVERALEAFFAVLGGEERGQGGGEQVAGGDAAQFLEIAIGEDGVRQRSVWQCSRRFLRMLRSRADVADERHHHLFANGIDGRIGDLREKLLEVIEQRLRLIGETGERRIGAHGADGLFAVGGHGSHEHAQIFVGVAEGALAPDDGGGIGAVDARGLGQFVERDLVPWPATRRKVGGRRGSA